MDFMEGRRGRRPSNAITWDCCPLKVAALSPGGPAAPPAAGTNVFSSPLELHLNQLVTTLPGTYAPNSPHTPISPFNRGNAMTQNFIDKARNSAAVAVTSLGIGLGLWSGCTPEASKGAHKEPDRNALTNALLPAVPKATANEAIVKVMLSPEISYDVKKALLNPKAHDILNGIIFSAEQGAPLTYRRNDHPNEDGRDCVKIIQYLLNSSRDFALQKGNTLITKLEQQIKATPEQEARWLKEEHKSLKFMIERAPAHVKIDGDYGPASHKERAWVTYMEWQFTRHQTPFPHSVADKGANDTKIGPRTFKEILFRAEPGIGVTISSEWQTVLLSNQAAHERVAEAKQRSNLPQKR